MSLQENFDKAVVRSKELTQRPSNEELLKLYSLFKQGTEGDNTGDRPGGFDFKGAAKHDAWESLKGTLKEEAMEQYTALVEELHSKN